MATAPAKEPEATAAWILENVPARYAVGRLCRLCRIASGATVRGFAASVGVTPTAIRDYERGRMCPVDVVRCAMVQAGGWIVDRKQFARAAYLYSMTYKRMGQRLKPEYTGGDSV